MQKYVAQISFQMPARIQGSRQINLVINWHSRKRRVIKAAALDIIDVDRILFSRGPKSATKARRRLAKRNVTNLKNQAQLMRIASRHIISAK